MTDDTQDDPEPPPAGWGDTEYYAAVGRVSVEGAGLELALNALLSVIVGRRGSYVTKGQPVGVLIQMLKSVSRAFQPPLAVEIRAAAKQASQAMRERDDVAHGARIGVWDAEEGGLGYGIARNRRYRGHELSRTYIPELGEIANRLLNAHRAVLRVTNLVAQQDGRLL